MKLIVGHQNSAADTVLAEHLGDEPFEDRRDLGDVCALALRVFDEAGRRDPLGQHKDLSLPAAHGLAPPALLAALADQLKVDLETGLVGPAELAPTDVAFLPGRQVTAQLEEPDLEIQNHLFERLGMV